MTRCCARPDCSDIATARFFFDARAKLVIVDPLIDEWGGSGVLCTAHADRMTAPRGWTLDDRRVQAPRLFNVGRFDALHPSPAAASPAPVNDAPDDATDGAADDATVAIHTGDAPVGTASPAPSRRTTRRRLTMPEAHPSTPLPLDGGPLYELPDAYAHGGDDAGTAGTNADLRVDHPVATETPLLARAFEAARSRMRADSSLDVLVGRTAAATG